jgi:hypothetical protein
MQQCHIAAVQLWQTAPLQQPASASRPLIKMGWCVVSPVSPHCLQAETKADSLIKAKTVEDDCLETPEEVASKFNGTCKRLGPGSAAYVYWGSGGYALGVFCLVIFGVTQACRIIGDWWIRWAAVVMCWCCRQPATQQCIACRGRGVICLCFSQPAGRRACRPDPWCFAAAATALLNSPGCEPTRV